MAQLFETPLLLAAVRDNKSIVRTLLEARADMDAKDEVCWGVPLS